MKGLQNENHGSHYCTWRFDNTVDGNGWSLLFPNHSGWPLPCRLSQFRNAKTKRSACVGVKVMFVYCLLMSPPSLVSERKIFSWPWRTIMSPSYTLFEVQCSYHLGTTWVTCMHCLKLNANSKITQLTWIMISLVKWEHYNWPEEINRDVETVW